MKLPTTRAIAALTACFLANGVFGSETQSDPSHALEKVTVQSKSSQSILGDSALRTMVISSDDIEKVHAKTLDDALRYTPGISIKPIGNNSENGSGISIQGLDASQTLIMVDGNPVPPNSGDMLDVVDVSQILIGDVESIEIIQGGASAIYGANAMGGVVNITTKNPDKKLSFAADLSAGNWGDISDQRPVAKDSSILTASSKSGNFSTQVTANLLNQEGYDTDANESGTDGWHGYKNNFSAKLKYDVSDNQTLTIAPSFYRAQTATYKVAQDIYKTLKEDQITRDRDTWDMTYQGYSDNIFYKFHAMNQDYKEVMDGTVLKLNQNSKSKNYDLTLSTHAGSSHFLSMAVEHRYEFISQYDFSKDEYLVDEKSKKSTDIAFTDNWLSAHGVELSPTLRINEDDLYGTHFSPLLSVMYSSKNPWFADTLNIRTSIADGYKTPTLKELYWQLKHNQTLYTGNENLKPESSLSTQLSFEFLSNNATRLEVNLFNNEIKNLIGEQANPEKAAEYDEFDAVNELTNINTARTRGVDLAYQTSFDFMSFNAGYSYLDAKNIETGKQLPKKSKDSVQLGVNFFNYSGMQLSLKYSFYSKQFTDFENDEFVKDFDVVDLKFNHDLSNQLSWYMGIDNLNNNIPEQFSVSTGHGVDGNDIFPKSPRYMYLGIRFKH